MIILTEPTTTPFLLLEFAAKEKLEIVNVYGFAGIFCPPFTPSRAVRGEDGIPLELFLEYTAFVRGENPLVSASWEII